MLLERQTTVVIYILNTLCHCGSQTFYKKTLRKIKDGTKDINQPDVHYSSHKTK